MRSNHLVLILLVLLGSAMAAWVFMSTGRPSTDDLARIKSLPATFKLADNEESGLQGIKLLRLIPQQKDSNRDLYPISSPLVLQSMKGFDATDCIDVGDHELLYLDSAKRIEYFGLNGTSITDVSLLKMEKSWPRLRFLAVQECKVSQQAILKLLRAKQLVFIEISAELNDPQFRDQVREISPKTIVMCNGQDVMDQPDSVYDSIPWDDWE